MLLGEIEIYLFIYFPCTKIDAESVGDHSNYGDTLYVPVVALDHRQHKSPEFDTLADALDFYKYANEAGFKLRINSSRKSRVSDDIIRKDYVCFKEEKTRRGICMP